MISDLPSASKLTTFWYIDILMMGRNFLGNPSWKTMTSKNISLLFPFDLLCIFLWIYYWSSSACETSSILFSFNKKEPRNLIPLPSSTHVMRNVLNPRFFAQKFFATANDRSRWRTIKVHQPHQPHQTQRLPQAKFQLYRRRVGEFRWVFWVEEVISQKVITQMLHGTNGIFAYMKKT